MASNVLTDAEQAQLAAFLDAGRSFVRSQLALLDCPNRTQLEQLLLIEGLEKGAIIVCEHVDDEKGELKARSWTYILSGDRAEIVSSDFAPASQHISEFVHRIASNRDVSDAIRNYDGPKELIVRFNYASFINPITIGLATLRRIEELGLELVIRGELTEEFVESPCLDPLRRMGL